MNTFLKYTFFVALLVLVSFWQSTNDLLILIQLLLGIILMFSFSFVDIKNLKDLVLKNPDFK
jgi:hypothetical protein